MPFGPHSVTGRNSIKLIALFKVLAFSAVLMFFLCCIYCVSEMDSFFFEIFFPVQLLAAHFLRLFNRCALLPPDEWIPRFE